MEQLYSEFVLEAGCDEAGRGCLAGPVVAAAVILKPNTKIEGINDSKKLSFNQRISLKDTIIENSLSWAVAFVDNHKIDEINILNASILAMHIALEKLDQQPNFIIVDGNRFKSYQNIPFKCIIKGDSKYQSIAAASILAKTSRDEFMIELDQKFPEYNWKQNKAYPTVEHKLAIQNFGFTEFHRKTFNSSLQLKFDY